MDKKKLDAIKELFRRRSAELDAVGPTASKHLARARLINSGLYVRHSDGEVHPAPQYGGPEIG